MIPLTNVITSSDPEIRNRSLESQCNGATLPELLAECAALRPLPPRRRQPLRAALRALFFLYAIHRFHVPFRESAPGPALIPFVGYTHLLKRRFEEAIQVFLATQAAHGPSAALSSALAAGYRALGFQTLADQVRRSIAIGPRQSSGCFALHTPPIIHFASVPRNDRKAEAPGRFPHPARDHSRAPWISRTAAAGATSYILGMDFPEGAQSSQHLHRSERERHDPVPVIPSRQSKPICESSISRSSA